MFDNKNILLYPVSLIYGVLTGVRNFLYNTDVLQSEEFGIPVICVGNITVGGTGKTPHTEYLASLLRRHFRVAVLSRGYKRKTSDFRLAAASSTVQEIGDEPLQIARKFPDMMVAVEKDRVKGVKQMLRIDPEIEVILLDDGFQHRKLTPGFSILLTDFHRPMSKDHLLPFGSLRESSDNMKRADVILITKTPEDISPIDRRITVTELGKLPYQNLYFTAIKYQQPVPVFNKDNPGYSLGWNSFSGNGAILVTGIANPAPLADHLRRTFSEVVHLPFPDHHNFSDEDIAAIHKSWNELKTPVRYIITTEKDAIRLGEFTNFADEIKSAFYYIPVGIEFLNDDKDEFEKLIIEYVRKNKRNNRISG